MMSMHVIYLRRTNSCTFFILINSLESDSFQDFSLGCSVINKQVDVEEWRKEQYSLPASPAKRGMGRKEGDGLKLNVHLISCISVVESKRSINKLCMNMH